MTMQLLDWTEPMELKTLHRVPTVEGCYIHLHEDEIRAIQAYELPPVEVDPIETAYNELYTLIAKLEYQAWLTFSEADQYIEHIKALRNETTTNEEMV